MAATDVSPEVEAEARDVQGIVSKIRPLLQGNPPHIIGAVLGDLVSTFVAGHHPDLRDLQIEMLVKLVRQLVPVEVDFMVATGKVGEDWRGDTDEQRAYEKDKRDGLN